MRVAESNRSVGYYFALPRLVNRFRGASTRRSEQNALEAHVVGTLVHLITFAYAVTALLGHRPFWQQVLLLLPVAVLVWALWSVFFYLSALLIQLLRSIGLLRDMPDNRAQSLVVGLVTTLLAWQLASTASWVGVLGWIWLIAVALNLTAAAMLALVHAEPAR